MIDHDRSIKGFSLIETMISIVLLSLIVLVVARLFSGGTRSMTEARQTEQASAFVQMIEARMRATPFHDVFAYDTAQKTVVYPSSAAMTSAYLSTFTAGNYFVPLAQSRAASTLTFLEDQMRAQGFTRFQIGVRYIRRDSSDQADNEQVEDYIAFNSTNLDGCDDVDPALCFRDCTGDGQYYGFCPDGKPEVPDSGLKLITFSVYKKNQLIAVRRGTFLTKSGVTGAETPSSESPLKLNVSTPTVGWFAFQGRPDLVDNLEMVSIRDYPASWYGVNGSSLRIDNYPTTVNLFRGTFPITAGTDSYYPFSGWTEPGAAVDFFIGDVFWSPPAVNPVPVDTALSPPNGVFDLRSQLDLASGALAAIGRGQAVMWSRAHNGSYYSPYDKRPPILMDDTPPWVGFKGPEGSPVTAPINTLSPFIYALPTDLPYSTGGSLYFYTAVCTMELKEQFSVGASTIAAIFAGFMTPCGGTGSSLWTWNNWTNEYCGYSVDCSDPEWGFPVGWPMNFLFKCGEDSGNLILQPGRTYEVRMELGDYNMYKSSTVWTFTTPTVAQLAADITAPEISLPTPARVAGIAGSTLAWADPTGVSTYTVAWVPGRRVEFSLWRLNDPESGIQLRSVIVDICQADGVTGCTRIYDYASAGANLGIYFNLKTLRKKLSTGNNCAYTFPFAQAAPWRVRIKVKNWAGVEAVRDDWYIRVN